MTAAIGRDGLAVGRVDASDSETIVSGVIDIIRTGPGIGHTSTHLPRRVQSSSVSLRRASKAIRNSSALSDMVFPAFQ